MELLPGLRLSDRAGTALRGADRPRGSEAPASSARFEEHLNGAHRRDEAAPAGSRASLDTPGASRAEDGAKRARSERDAPAERSSAVDGDSRQRTAPAARQANAGSNSTVEAEGASAPAPSQPGPRGAPTSNRAHRGTPGLEAGAAAAPAAAVEALAAGTTGPAAQQHAPAETAPANAALLAAPPVLPAPLPVPAPGLPTAALPVDGPLAAAGVAAVLAHDVAELASTAAPGESLPDAPAAADAPSRTAFESLLAPRDARAETLPLRETADVQAPQAARAEPAREAAAEILRQVRVGLSSDLREANIQLAPEALGRVSIRLRVEDGGLTADVRAETTHALRALELHAPELKAALAQSGVEPRSLVFGYLGGDAGRASDQGHASHRFAPFPAGRGLRDGDPSPLAPVEVERALARRLSPGGVDTYA